MINAQNLSAELLEQTIFEQRNIKPIRDYEGNLKIFVEGRECYIIPFGGNHISLLSPSKTSADSTYTRAQALTVANAVGQDLALGISAYVDEEDLVIFTSSISIADGLLKSSFVKIVLAFIVACAIHDATMRKNAA